MLVLFAEPGELSGEKFLEIHRGVLTADVPADRPLAEVQNEMLEDLPDGDSGHPIARAIQARVEREPDFGAKLQRRELHWTWANGASSRKVRGLEPGYVRWSLPYLVSVLKPRFCDAFRLSGSKRHPAEEGEAERREHHQGSSRAPGACIRVLHGARAYLALPLRPGFDAMHSGRGFSPSPVVASPAASS